MEEVYKQAQERQQVFELIVGDRSVWGQARHALEACGSQARALQERAVQYGRGLQSQMEQAALLTRGVGGPPAHTPVTSGGPPNRSRTSFTDPTGSISFRFIGPEDVARLKPSEAQRQDERHRELLMALRDLGRLVVPQDSLQAERLTPVPAPPISLEPLASPTRPNRKQTGRHPRSKDTEKLLEFLEKVAECVKTHRKDNSDVDPTLDQIRDKLPPPFTWKSQKTFYNWSQDALMLVGYPSLDMRAWIRDLPR